MHGSFPLSLFMSLIWIPGDNISKILTNCIAEKKGSNTLTNGIPEQKGIQPNTNSLERLAFLKPLAVYQFYKLKIAIQWFVFIFLLMNLNFCLPFTSILL
jgi:hypothetical protein